MADEDQGIHRSATYVFEKELKAAGWHPIAAHPNSPTWRAPDGQLYPGAGWAWSVMKARLNKA